jgi:hypothetical protein
MEFQERRLADKFRHHWAIVVRAWPEWKGTVPPGMGGKQDRMPDFG